MWRRGWRRIVGGRAPSGAPTPAGRADAIRTRLAALEVQQLDLLADESIPGRKHRLDAVRSARRDLEAELAELAGLDGAGAAEDGCGLAALRAAR